MDCKKVECLEKHIETFHFCMLLRPNIDGSLVLHTITECKIYTVLQFALRFKILWEKKNNNKNHLL